MDEERLKLVLEYCRDSTGRKILEDMISTIGKYIKLNSNNILDIASSKKPRISSQIAQIFPESCITHFRDNNPLEPRLEKKYSRISNLEIVDSYDGLNPPYDIALALFTIHELDDPLVSLKKAANNLKPGGMIISADYSLEWLPVLAEEMGWDDDKVKNFFAKHIFTVGNERAVIKKEKDCIQRHSQRGLNGYIDDFSMAGFTHLDSKVYNIQTPYGEKPKLFLYVGKKA